LNIRIVEAAIIAVILNSVPISIYAQGAEQISGNSIPDTQESIEEPVNEVSKNTADAAEESENSAEEERPGEFQEIVSDNIISENAAQESAVSYSGQAYEDVQQEEIKNDAEEVSENEIRAGEIELSRPDVISVELPLVEENKAVFDFILDPDQLINATGAVKYGGKRFQEGATVFFENKREDGETEYTDTSDPLEIINRSTVSVNLVINVTLTGIEGIAVENTPAFTESENPAVWFELADEEGNTVSLNNEGTAYLSYIIEAAPEEAYMYSYNEETGKYEPESRFEETEFPKYKFAVRAACSRGGWSKVKEMPKLTVRWEVNPIINDMETVYTEQTE